MQAAGLCHSDVGILEDEKWLDSIDLPAIPGHEIAGVVTAVGDDNTGYQLGDRVCVWPMSTAGKAYGYGRAGGWGEFVVADIEDVLSIPDGVTFELAAAATDAGMTSYGAITAVGYEGRVMQIGMGRLESTIDTYPLIMKHVALVGHTGGARDAIAQVLKYMASGDITPAIELTDFAGIPEGIDRLHRGEVRGRLVSMY